jgi:hypothetical protein
VCNDGLITGALSDVKKEETGQGERRYIKEKKTKGRNLNQQITSELKLIASVERNAQIDSRC